MKKILFILSIIFSEALFAIEKINFLNDSDEKIYRDIFLLQSLEQIDKAIKLENKIENDILIGEVLYQRYTSKTYRTKGQKLKLWMDKYYNTPGAPRISKIAKIKKTSVRNVALPKLINGKGVESANLENWTTKTYSKNIQKNINVFKKYIKSGSSKRARILLEDKSFTHKLLDIDYGRLAGRLAFLYYTNGEDELAKKWGFVSSDLNSEYGLWTMGLLYFKEEKYKESFKYFSKILDNKQINKARQTETAFWTARSLEKQDEVRKAKKYYKIAAKYPMSFYGALASSKINGYPYYEFFEKDYNTQDLEEIKKYKYGKIAIALIQVGQINRADMYLRLLITEDKSNQTLHAISSISTAFGLPGTALQVASVMKDKGILEIDDDIIYSAQYPLPDWEPTGGWSIDRSLLLAITKQESSFKQNARSSVGASGLMQIMPKTAKLIAKKNNIRYLSTDMLKPEHNMYLGQQYIVDLLKHPRINKNIIKMLIAYNSGMGNLVKFERTNNITDPLLYLESFPAFETRNYIKRVIANVWLYKAKLEQDLSDIENLADGLWLFYTSEDDYVKKNSINSTIL